jgi:thiosulfate/3-mercaptopyruvate sulfurtransferase
MESPAIVAAAELAREIDNPEWVVVDVRFNLMSPDAGRIAYTAGHIPGAVYADLDKDLAGPVAAQGGRHPLPDADALAGLFGAWGIEPGIRVVVYDDAGGAIAARLWWLLRWMGHDAVALLDGGLQAWEAEGHGLEQSHNARSSVRFTGRPGSMPVVTAAELPALMARGVLLDARDRDRFLGRHEPIDRVAGHVPGAVNAPFRDNLDAHGRFLPGDELARRYRQLLAPASGSRVACMCGSGVTACHTIVALELAGLPGASLYVGSWSDWISDDRPVGGEAA